MVMVILWTTHPEWKRFNARKIGTNAISMLRRELRISLSWVHDKEDEGLPDGRGAN